MRIVVDYGPALRERTGVGEYIHQLVRAYTAAHTDHLVLFSSSWKDRLTSPLSDPALELVDRRVPVRVLNYLWHRMGWPPVEALTGAADVVHAAHPLLIPARKAAQVVTIHDLFFLSHPERTHREIRRDYPVFAAKHAQAADAVVTSTDHGRRLISEKLDVPADRIYVCPPGAPTWRTLGQKPNVPPAGYALFVGTLEARKNIGTLLDAYTLLLGRQWKPAPLVLAGRPTADAAEWLSRIAKPPLSDHVTYRGYVPEDQRERLYAGARLVVIPSLDEGFGFTALEAMSAGIPVLASDRGSLPEVVGDAGILIDPTDREALAGALERALTDEPRALELARKGLERARARDWQQAASRLHGAYTDAVRRRRDRA